MKFRLPLKAPRKVLSVRNDVKKLSGEGRPLGLFLICTSSAPLSLAPFRAALSAVSAPSAPSASSAFLGSHERFRAPIVPVPVHLLGIPGNRGEYSLGCHLRDVF